jgi:hypothetical protein
VLQNARLFPTHARLGEEYHERGLGPLIGQTERNLVAVLVLAGTPEDRIDDPRADRRFQRRTPSKPEEWAVCSGLAAGEAGIRTLGPP